MVRLARQDGTDIPFVVTAVTDDRGEFVLRGLVPSRYRLWARKGREAGRHPEALAVHDAEALSLVVSLERRPSVSGRVLSEAGQPVAGAELWFSWEEGTAAQEPQAVTDREGHYRIEGVLPGTYELRAVAPGFAPGRARIAVAEADLTAVDHRLATEARIHGRVLTSAGAPAPAVHVIALPARRPGPGEPMLLTARTLADGSYLFEGVQPGQFRIGAEDATFGVAQAMTVWTLAPGEKREVNLQLEPGAALSGRVRRADGSPAASVVVTAYQGPTGYAASSGRRAPAPTAPSWSGRWSTGKPAFWRRPQSWPRSLVAFPPGPRPSPSNWPRARTPATSS
jgi:protocatechuate 3,4-dioxygenase beta subunit